jgi:hypothetical protein
LDPRRTNCGRFRDRLASSLKAIEVEGDRLADQLLHLLLGVADDAKAGQVRTVGPP